LDIVEEDFVFFAEDGGVKKRGGWDGTAWQGEKARMGKPFHGLRVAAFSIGMQ